MPRARAVLELVAMLAATAAGSLLAAAPVMGAAATLTAMSGNPCPPPQPNDGAPSPFIRMLLTPGARFVRPAASAREKEQADRAAAEQRARDWADLCRYRADNAALTRHPRVVLMGDSITDFWRQGYPRLFDGGTADIVDRGISGQTSGQMLVRFWPDVIALHPNVVQILAGTNDIAGNTGPTTEQDYENNIKTMVELAQAHHIRVLLGSIPPAVAFWWAPRPYRPAGEIRRLNEWLRQYARASGAGFIDYYAHLVTPTGAFRPHLSNDGVHPNAAGYGVMSGLLQAALMQDR
ncbi:MAG TPA: SGNH/GDSL hydrolase family protein [Steroidobacteraceae bacterium]|jgi:lysophospholipase L1-like esterase